MKKYLIPFISVLSLLLCASCTRGRSSAPVISEYTYYPAAEDTTAVPTTVSETTTLPEETSLVAETVIVSAEVQTTMILVTLVPETVPTEPAAPPAEDTTVDLQIELPSANAKMQVDRSPSNRYIRAVSQARGLNASTLAAVVSVPDNGDNYVFEFTSADGRTVNDLRRVFLLDADCRIVSVASSDSALKENISSTENWFCMNVLIKGVIFPAIANDL